MKTVLVWALLLVGLVGCGQGWPWSDAQQRVCGRLDPDQCAEVIARVEAVAPETKRSQLVVADLALPPGVNSYGAFLALVAFEPWDASQDTPQMWTVSKGAIGWFVQPWRGQSVPEHFAQELSEAGAVP